MILTVTTQTEGPRPVGAADHRTVQAVIPQLW